MKGLFLALALFGGIGQAALAADTEAARTRAVRAYLALPAVQQGLDACFGVDGIQAAIDKDLVKHGVSAADRAKVKAILAESVEKVRPVLMGKMLEVMVRVYTLGEIEAMTAFGRTPAGASVQRKAGIAAIEIVNEVKPLTEKTRRDMMVKLRRAFP